MTNVKYLLWSSITLMIVALTVTLSTVLPTSAQADENPALTVQEKNKVREKEESKEKKKILRLKNRPKHWQSSMKRPQDKLHSKVGTLSHCLVPPLTSQANLNKVWVCKRTASATGRGGSISPFCKKSAQIQRFRKECLASHIKQEQVESVLNFRMETSH
jgi:hypothetical protein